MAQLGNSGAGQAKTFAMVLLFVVLIGHGELAESNSVVHKVGGKAGWDIGIQELWPPRGMRFRAGDYLLFTYQNMLHNVVKVDKKGYETCTYSSSKVYTSGSDRIKLHRGTNYFICIVSGHCGSGMRIAVEAT